MATRRVTALLGKSLSASVIALALGMPLSGAAQAAAGHTSPAVRPAVRTVKAALIHPFDQCSPSVGWSDLAANWSEYGTTRLRIDVRSFCNTQVTYAGLVASKAQVLVFSDVAGAQYQLSSSEISAITQYVQAGHNIVATYLTFAWSSWNNSALAPLFGLTPSFATTSPFITPDYKITQTDCPLFTAVPNPYDSHGYPDTQTPAGGQWNAAALSGARYVAHNKGRTAAITLYTNKADHYRAVYVSTMPEFGNPDTADLQFLYNALTLGP
jgi:hypothetical protein